MKSEVIEKLAALITAAFGLVAALAWNDTIRAIFARYSASDSITSMIIYSIIVTIIAVLITIWIGKIAAKKK